MLISKNYLPSANCFKIYYKCNEELDIMGFEDHYNPENESDIIHKQTKFFIHLKNHNIKSSPNKAEFIILFGSLLESKIRNKIIKEINSHPISYLDELPTLIVRSKPYDRIEKNSYNPSEQLSSLISHNERVEEEAIESQWSHLIESIKKLPPISLGEFVSKCYSYNSPGPIFKMLSDFALFENWEKNNPKKRNFDLHDEQLTMYLLQRNNVVHELLNAEINNTEYIKQNLENILKSIVSMVETALEVRRISIDTFKSAEKTNVDFQLSWLKKIKGDCNKNKMKNWNKHGYSKLFTTETTVNKLDSESEYLIKKLGGDSNV